MFEKIKRYVKANKLISAHIALVVLVVVTTLTVPGLWGKAPAKASANKELTGVGAEMRKAPKEWFKEEKDLSAAIKDVRAGVVTGVGVAADSVLVSTKSGGKYFVQDSRYGAASGLMLNAYKATDKAEKGELFPVVFLDNVRHITPPGEGGPLAMFESIARLIGLMLPVAILIALLSFTKREGKGKFELTKATELRFSDVIGASEAKSALQDIVAYLKDPKAFAELGGKPSHGVLMVGPPGTGKTQLAKAVAGECGVSFIAISGSDFSSKFYGAGIERVKSLFKLARENAPCLVFIDEIDGIGKRSTGSDGPVTAESNRIVNQVLVELDGFKADEGVVVIGATNLVEMLDEAMLRPGRFDRRVQLKMPALIERKQLFELYAKKVKAADNLDYTQLARLTTGMSPASIASIVNQAALMASKSKSASVGMTEMMESIEVARMGAPDDGSLALSEKERDRIAVHEAGHAFIAHLLGAGLLEKVTILPRGGALGVTLVTQSEDRSLQMKSDLEKRIVMLLGGRCAEILFFDEPSTGAAHDLQEASKIALAMITQFGFGSKGTLFSIKAVTDPSMAQMEMASAISTANQMLLEYERQCMRLLTENKAAIRVFSDRLVAEETVPGSAVAEAISQVALPKAA